MNRNLTYEQQHDPPPIGVQLSGFVHHMRYDDHRAGRHLLIACIMAVALFAFEVFNYDTTRYALESLIGDVRFAGITWASILAVAFCSIDFAGLIRMFTPESEEATREAWYLMGAWLLGATMNAMMTWWAVSLTLLDHDFGNEVLSREALLRIVPIFVAVLVWLTRVLFIGAITYSGEMLRNRKRAVGRPQPVQQRRNRRPVHPMQQPMVQPQGTQHYGTVTTRQPVRIIEKPNATPRRAPAESLPIEPMEGLSTDFVEKLPQQPTKATKARAKTKSTKAKVTAKPKPKSKSRGLVRPKPQRTS